MFKGSIAALITPMTESGKVDYASLQKLVQFHIDNGTDAIVAVGTTGESATLPVKEHVEVVAATVQFSQGVIPVIAGTGANSTQEAIELGRAMSNTGVVGFLSVAPYYNKPQQRGMIAHFNAIADAAACPVLLYNVPSRSAVDLHNDSVAELAKHPNIAGIKDATGDLQRLLQLRPMVADDFVILSGDDASSCDFLNSGGDGVISVTANIVPKPIKNMCLAAAAGQKQRAIEINADIAQLHTALFIESTPVMPKWALHRMGLIQSSELRLPMVQPELSSQAVMLQLLRDLGLVA